MINVHLILVLNGTYFCSGPFTSGRIERMFWTNDILLSYCPASLFYFFFCFGRAELYFNSIGLGYFSPPQEFLKSKCTQVDFPFSLYERVQHIHIGCFYLFYSFLRACKPLFTKIGVSIFLEDCRFLLCSSFSCPCHSSSSSVPCSAPFLPSTSSMRIMSSESCCFFSFIYWHF